MKSEFQLDQEDYKVIEFTKKYVSKVLKQIDLTPRQIIGIGNYLYALERLPLKTQGVESYILLSNRIGDDKIWEMKTYGFTLSEDIFSIEVGGYVHGSNGGDSIVYPGWYIEAEGGRNTDAILWELEDQLSLLIHLGVEVKVEDLSEIEYEENAE